MFGVCFSSWFVPSRRSEEQGALTKMGYALTKVPWLSRPGRLGPVLTVLLACLALIGLPSPHECWFHALTQDVSSGDKSSGWVANICLVIRGRSID